MILITNTMLLVACIVVFVLLFFIIKIVTKATIDKITVDQMEANRAASLFCIGATIATTILLIANKSLSAKEDEALELWTIFSVITIAGTIFSLLFTRIEYVNILEASKKAETVADEIAPTRIISRLGITLIAISLLGTAGVAVFCFNTVYIIGGVITMSAAALFLAILVTVEIINNNNLAYQYNYEYQTAINESMPDVSGLFVDEKRRKSKVKARKSDDFFISTFDGMTPDDDNDSTQNDVEEINEEEDIAEIIAVFEGMNNSNNS